MIGYYFSEERRASVIYLRIYSNVHIVLTTLSVAVRSPCRQNYDVASSHFDLLAALGVFGAASYKQS